ncbi:MAG: hypothetical protein Kow0037_12320 [Calditrichia bacterium]
MDVTGEKIQKTPAELLQEIEELKAKLKRQDELYERSNMELIQHMVESEKREKQLKRLNALLKTAFLNTVEIIQNLIEIKAPGTKDHLERVAKGVSYISKKVNGHGLEADKIIIAAKIHEIGKIAIPDEILQKDRSELDESEQAMIDRHAILGAACIEEVPNFKGIASILRHLNENMNGSGKPDGLSGDQIPLGSRIIAIVNYFDSIFFLTDRHQTIESALAEVQDNLDVRFDRELFPHLYQYVIENYADAERPKDVKISPQQLKPGMVLSRRLLTASNVVLIPENTTLTEEIIAKVLKHQNIDPVNGGIYVFKG